MKKKLKVIMFICVLLFAVVFASKSSADEQMFRFGCRDWTRAWTICLPIVFNE